MKKIKTPITIKTVQNLNIGDKIEVHGNIFTGRDAALPKLVKAFKEGDEILDLEGSVIMHTAVSDAGISPTSSNKVEIEDNMPYLANHGVRIHIGKGALSKDTIDALDREKSIFVVTPPVAALLASKVKSKKVVAFKEEGMEAMYMLEVTGIPGIVAVAHGKSLYS